MKKYIFSAMLLGAAIVSSLTSCDDLLAPESDLVMYEEDNTLSTANDTLYSVVGVLHLMQQVADRTNLLGEIRADLITLTKDASTDLQDLASFNVADGNEYNKPEDYYAIINNCNYFINTVDPNYSKRGTKVFERELAAMRTFRAWAYLQLAINYGKVPFYTEFIGTEVKANEIMNGRCSDLKEICDSLIADLAPWATVKPLSYVGMDEQMFIPTRLMLGELCLWAERYTEAAQWYHDFLTDVNNPRPSNSTENSSYWNTNTKPAEYYFPGYINTFTNSREVIAYIPFERTPFDGTVSQLATIYQSSEDLNNYYYQAKPSNAAIVLSAEQRYYYEYIDEVSHKSDTVSMNDTIFVNDYLYGDLRLISSIDYGTVSSSSSSKYNDNYYDIEKVVDGEVTLYRLQTVYLHYAEALNLAGYPSAAFCILKYGLCEENIEKGYVTTQEVEMAGNLITFNESSFPRERQTAIHDRGCGDSYVNPEYVLPEPTAELASYADTVAFWQPFVEDKIVTESMLECAFEGVRYYDLLRTALRHNDPAILADPISKRNVLVNIPGKADEGEQDLVLREKLMNQSNWYLPLK